MKYTTLLNNNIKILESWDENEIFYIKSLATKSTTIEKWNENEIFKIKPNAKKG